VTGAVQHVFNTTPDGCTGAPVLTTGAVDPADGSIYFAAGNSPGTCSSPYQYTASILKFRASDLTLLDHWQMPAAEQTISDPDFGASPMLFDATIAGVQHPMLGLVNKTGVYYGECAEYCGAQHAHMAFNAVIDTRDDFNTWVTTQQQAAVAPAAGSLEAAGAKIFNGVCTTCHGIVGHGVAGNDNKYITGYQDPKVACDDPNKACLVGPNLTHFASRNLIAGGVLIHNRDQCLDPNNLTNCNLAKWLANPQGIKPGNDMVVNLTPEQIKDLVAYLESLN